MNLNGSTFFPVLWIVLMTSCGRPEITTAGEKAASSGATSELALTADPTIWTDMRQAQYEMDIYCGKLKTTIKGKNNVPLKVALPKGSTYCKSILKSLTLGAKALYTTTNSSQSTVFEINSVSTKDRPHVGEIFVIPGEFSKDLAKGGVLSYRFTAISDANLLGPGSEPSLAGKPGLADISVAANGALEFIWRGKAPELTYYEPEPPFYCPKGLRNYDWPFLKMSSAAAALDIYSESSLALLRMNNIEKVSFKSKLACPHLIRLLPVMTGAPNYRIFAANLPAGDVVAMIYGERIESEAVLVKTGKIAIDYNIINKAVPAGWTAAAPQPVGAECDQRGWPFCAVGLTCKSKTRSYGLFHRSSFVYYSCAK